MRELERDLPATHSDTRDAPPALTGLAIVGAGRAGRSIARAARSAGIEVTLHGRDAALTGLDPAAGAVLLCIPDDAIAQACERIAADLPAGIAVGHTSGATTLEALATATAAGCRAFSLHPLQTIPTAETDLAGSPCAVAAADPETLAVARRLAEALGMRPFDVAEEHRALYHAAASVASNFLITLEESAAELLAAAGVDGPREVLTPLVLRTAANWADSGAAALTGPIARGDAATVARHQRAIAREAPELATLYRVVADRTRELSGDES